ncbi:MAG: transcription termination/antitermination protein NusA [Candidatus Omnitrophica bacterium]|nr:transcription termination/antitermination protein NusA [Candidatus Omnitrophota bacterium]MCA9440987.1 transcription termination/antitermination protein NusA [Candidatus Omnitrophota bacterium]MCB9767798.1 transcription termination/antitermination protein NusA [Candidatus Omnitrophota bacterium]MCB9781963.1 transcription termination/antitermination protein NusA [Candidatus Omnitrophota bacterium]
MSKESQDLLRRIANERNIALEVLEDALEAALISASKKMLDPEMEVTRATTDPETGDYRVFAEKTVVEEVDNEALEISLPEARMFDLDIKLGDTIEIDVTPHDFGRIAAQNAKQVVTQRIREAEREMVYERYCNKIGELVSGTVQQTERGNVIVDIGYAEAYLPFNEQPRGERYHYGDRVRAVITEVSQSHRDAQVLLSRKSPELVKKLFEQEVTEVRDGTVVIKGVAREPGKRSKIAVMSTNLDVDPVGACVGMKGSRVQMVVQELKGERIDIIPYSNDRSKFVQNSLKPAEVESVDLNEEDGRATLVVRDDQLSLAIGKGGLNAKLASELTGLEIDIVSVSELEASERETREMLMSLPGADEDLIETLMSGGVFSYEDILDYEVEGLVETLNLDQNTAESLYEASRKFVAGEETPSYLLEEEEKPADIDQKVEGEPEQEPVAEESSEKEEPSEASAEENQETEEPTSVG